MSNQEASRTERTVLRRKLTRSVNNLKKLIGQGMQVGDVEIKFGEVESLWSDLQDKHDSYVALTCDDDEEKIQAEDQWLMDVESVFEELQIEVVTLKNDKEKGKILNLRREAKMFREMEQGALNMLLSEAEGILDDKDIVRDGLLKMKEKIEHQMSRCLDAQKKYLSLSSEENYDDAISWNAANDSKSSLIQHQLLEKLKTCSILE